MTNPRPKNNFIKITFWAFFLFLFVPIVGFSADLKETVDTKTENEVYLFRGDLVALKVYSLTRIAISSPDIVDISSADVNEVLLIGKKVGTTQIFIWDELGKRQVIASVLSEDLDLVIARIQKLFKSANIDGVSLERNNYEGKVVLSGKVPSEKYNDFKAVVDKFGNNVVNLVKEQKIEDLIQIDAQITEINTTLEKTMGVDWATSVKDSPGIVIPYKEAKPNSLDGSVKDWFKIGKFSRQENLAFTLQMLIAEGKARVLSKPSIVMTNGETASLLVGGEIPISTTSTAAAGGTISTNVSFKSYGINLNVTPVIRDNKIDLTVNVNVRDIDDSTPITSGGNSVAFVTRSAKTKVFLEDGETTVIAGLIKQNQSEKVKRIPFLSKIPIAGMLFRNNVSPKKDTELVITITPKIYKGEQEEAAAAELKAAEAKAAVEKRPTEEVAANVEEVSPEKDMNEELGPLPPEDMEDKTTFGPEGNAEMRGIQPLMNQEVNEEEMGEFDEAVRGETIGTRLIAGCCWRSSISA